jgi:hypothetical protein
MKRAMPKSKISLLALVTDIRKSAVKILHKPKSTLIGHQGWKAEQKILALWAADCAEHVLPFFEKKYPKDERPRKAIEACREWVATGVFKMADVRNASLDAHAAAREAKEEDAIAAARSAGHAVATAHVPTHAFGAAVYAMYAVEERTLIRLRIPKLPTNLGIKAAALHSKNPKVAITRERDWQLKRLRKIAQHNI